MPGDFEVILSTKMDEQIKLLWERLRSELQIQTITITENVTASVNQTLENKLKPIIEENQALKEEIGTLKSRVQTLEKETRKSNVILHGIPEKEGNRDELLKIVLDTLNNMSKKADINEWDKWEISDITRIGRRTEKKTRPILIKLTLAWRKIELLRNKKHFMDNIYATDDFPKNVIEKRKELKTKLEEEIKKGNIAYIRYDRLIIKNKEETNEKRKRSPSQSPKILSGTPESQTKAPNKLSKTNAFSYMRARSNSNKDSIGK